MRDLVVGTGLTGLYKAFKLFKNGHDIKVKELNKMTY